MGFTNLSSILAGSVQERGKFTLRYIMFKIVTPILVMGFVIGLFLVIIKRY